MRGRRLGADPRPSLYACALAAAAAEGHGGRDQPDGYHEPQQQRDPLDAQAPPGPAPRDPAGVPPFAAGTAIQMLTIEASRAMPSQMAAT